MESEEAGQGAKFLGQCGNGGRSWGTETGVLELGIAMDFGTLHLPRLEEGMTSE